MQKDNRIKNYDPTKLKKMSSIRFETFQMIIQPLTFIHSNIVKIKCCFNLKR
jgi:hypothetical protein